MGNIILMRVLMIPCGVLVRFHLINTKSIALLVSGRCIVGGLWDAR